VEEGRAAGSAIEIEPEQGKKCLWGEGTRRIPISKQRRNEGNPKSP